MGAQAPVFEAVLKELGAGQKRTHWMWFVFPQERGLGRSETARHYGIASLDEARAYLAHETLGPRLVHCTELVLAIEHESLYEIFGAPDDLKFCSSMKLFASVDGDSDGDSDGVFARAARRYCGG